MNNPQDFAARVQRVIGGSCNHATFDPSCDVCWLVGIDPTWPETYTDPADDDPLTGDWP